MGALANSVNLFTGDVNFPLTLISMPGRNGLNVNVSISYNSNIQNIVDTWNLEAPTGVLGLGWSFDYEKIIVDHKNTGSRHDDDFYLIAGGGSNLLVRIGLASDNPREYKAKSYQFWKILYYPVDEHWEVVKEDGMTYIYGDKNSNRYTVQWGVKWGNWIGSTAETTGQTQFANAWNLSSIKNKWGDEITFEYLNIEQFVGSTLWKKHTEASYLKKIMDVYGRVVDFTYAEKTTSEYQAPQTESNEPDAYQERYEKKVIDYIEVFDAQNNRLFTIDFDYNFHGTGDLTKRLLAKITQKNALSESMPSMKFEYNSGAPNEAALKKITLPQGGTIEYTYIEKTIERSDRQASIQAPLNFGKPQVFVAEDYVVVTWLNTSTNELKVYAYLWDGEWVESLVETINNVTIVNAQTNAQSFGIVVEKDFFAIVNNLDLSQQSKPVYIFRKNPYKRGDWLKHAVTISISGGSGGAHGAWLASGEDFVTVLGKERGQLFRFRWKGDSWTLIADPAVDNDANDDFYLAGTNNYFT